MKKKNLFRILVIALVSVFLLTACQKEAPKPTEAPKAEVTKVAEPAKEEAKEEKPAEEAKEEKPAEEPAKEETKEEKPAEDKKVGFNLSPVGTYPLVEEPVKMTMFRLSMPNVQDYATNDFTKFMEEKTNVQWEFLIANNDTVDEQINLTMSSDPLPDVFLFSTPDAAKYGMREKLLLPIEDLIKDNMPNFNKYLEENPSVLGIITQPDGHIYGLPSINDCFHCKYRNKMWVNTKHLADLGVEAPKTTEEFKEVIKKYLEANPKGVGITGSIGGWGQQFEDWITNAFILDPGTAKGKVVVSKDKKIESIAVKDEYREALKYMNELFKMGAIYDGSFTQNYEQFRALMNEEGDPVLFAPYGTISDAYDASTRGESYASYAVMEPIEGPKGVRNATYFMHDGVGRDAFVITKDCKYPELALRWIDYFYSLEGYLSMQFGADAGKDWVLNPEGKVGLNGEPALYEILNQYSSEAQNHDWQDVGLNFATDTIRLGQATDPNVDVTKLEGLEKLLYDASQDKCAPYGQDADSPYQVVPRLKLTAEEQVDIEQILVDVDKYLKENRTQFIRGELDPTDDTAWKNYVDGFEKVGLNKLLETYQTAYDRQYGK
ncbi:MAG: extracellular solute-binding protein [Eubacteriales bacterium]|nr:extracellular solute-binding protein [Eubacteriales bacterium]